MPSVVVNPFVELVVDGALFIAIFYVFYRVCSYIFSTLFDPINIAWPASDTKIFGKKRVAGKVPPYYPNGWYKVCDSDTLQKGQTRNFEILGQNLVLFRGENGEASILDAYCPHLGANMGVTGSVKGNCIECPFHGWQFDKTGNCTHIPYCEGSIPEQAKVKAWPVCEKNGMIHIFYHVDGIEPYWEVPTMNEIHNGYACHGKFSCYIRAHCQEVPENGPDTAHLNILHKPALTWMPSTWVNHIWSATYAPGKEPEQYYSNVRVIQNVQLFGKNVPFTKTDGKIRQIGPALVHMPLQTSVGLFIVIEAVTPVEPLLQRVEHIIFGPNTWWARPIGKFMMVGFSKQFIRDVHIWNNKQYFTKPVLVKGDGPIAQFRRWYSQFYSENSIKGDLDMSW